MNISDSQEAKKWTLFHEQRFFTHPCVKFPRALEPDFQAKLGSHCWWCLRTKQALRSLSELSMQLSFTGTTTTAYMDKMINRFDSNSHYF